MFKYNKLAINNNLQSSIITIGNFDGMHKGHQFILQSLIKFSKNFSIPSVVVTFDPHTNNVIFKKNDKILLPLEHKLKMIKKCGIDHIGIISFNEQISKLTADLFLDKIIVKFNPKYILIGYDNSFGFNREGNYKYFHKNNKYNKIKFVECPKYTFEDCTNIKSSIIRGYILDGEVNKANLHLGHIYTIFGNIIKGNRIGRKIGYPTANINLINKEQLVPSNGVYSVNLRIDNNVYSGICNIGHRPTLNISNEIKIEVHITEKGNFNIYDVDVEVEFLNKIRNEIKFNNKFELIDQIGKDIKSVH